MIPSPRGAHRPGGATPKGRNGPHPDGERPWRAFGTEMQRPRQMKDPG